MPPRPALAATWFRASASKALLANVLTLLLRFANIFFAVAAPLLWHRNSAMLRATPLMGLGSILVVVAVIYRPATVPRILALSWMANVLCGALLIVLFAFDHGAPSWVFPWFAGALGVGMTGTEMAAMRLAVRPSRTPALRVRVSWFSFMKALGIGSGFLVGGAVAGAPQAALPARLLVGIAGSATLVISLLLLLGWDPQHGVEPAEASSAEGGPPAEALTAMGLITLNFVVVTLANCLIPYRLAHAGGLRREWVGLLLAVEAYAHALGTLAFRNGLGGLGDRVSYALGVVSTMALGVVLVAFPRCGYAAAAGLLAAFGLTSAASYMTSTILFYATAFPRAIFPRVATQKLASSLGRALGSWIAIKALSRFSG